MITSNTVSGHNRDSDPVEQFVLRLPSGVHVRTFVDELFGAADDVDNFVYCGTITLGSGLPQECSVSARVVLLPPATDGGPARSRLAVTAHRIDAGPVGILDLDMQQLGDLDTMLKQSGTLLAR